MESLSKTAHRRLFPSITDPTYLTLRARRLIFTSWAREFHNRRLKVLDVGGRYQPYRPLFEPNIGSYVAVDLVQTEFVNVVADGERLPFAPASFDLVIATQVFEYFRDPREAAKAVHHVLKPGGALLASFAACTPRFVDDEKWRFTPGGLRSILEPFAKVEVIPELHSVAGLIRTVNLGLDTFVRYEFMRQLYRLTGAPLLNCLGLALEGMNLTQNDQFTTNFSVMAVKGE
ncbi:MAG: class I SAM-dependent methyltransferase [Terriglobales bacterium]|jgi:SAM-dependent methyltransferase